jgi:succinyl-diaminopimelate desuccinylase
MKKPEAKPVSMNYYGINPMLELRNLMRNLIAFESVTPEDAGCQEYMMHLFKSLGFTCQVLNHHPVSNFYAHKGTHAPLLIFAGHTDVVPVGDHHNWLTDPFVLHEKDGILYGRGTADMKGSLACMLSMAERFVKKHPKFKGSLGFLITSGEEGDYFDKGTPYVMEQLHMQGIHPDYCIVGEPSSTHKTGDVIKIGRRGSLSGKLHLKGKQGHVAYPQLANNPIHGISPVLAALIAKQWDLGNAFFPPTSLQITHIHSGGHASNIIPGTLNMDFNFRFSTEQTAVALKQSVLEMFTERGLDPTINWRLTGHPFLTTHGKLLDSCQNAIHQHTGHKAELATGGGTSDGRFIAPYGVEVVELGPVNATIHQVNEHVTLEDLEALEAIYLSICEGLLVD